MTAGPWALALAGWDDLSIWGYDDGVGTLYAQLSRNGGNDDNGFEIWVTPPSYPIITAPAILAEHIASATHAPVPEVQAALNDAVDSQGGPESFRIS